MAVARLARRTRPRVHLGKRGKRGHTGTHSLTGLTPPRIEAAGWGGPHEPDRGSSCSQKAVAGPVPVGEGAGLSAARPEWSVSPGNVNTDAVTSARAMRFLRKTTKNTRLWATQFHREAPKAK